ncbi:hypothetical protein E7811_09440 [Aliigemmobacter aestuarii]|uniref:Uncharacterized protein n=1 Tax=Aliigemmobacter aestuarii TaxID=1445661 RepID=A0A4S3MM77_9RHOB|nr:hypothetical protein [Gemmobacter aestuarii]THD83498.1 hypothetical protein E7811_09440 [Gemmobacter aestuarii]
MGPFRGRLIAAGAGLAAPRAALAEVCDKIRPAWDAAAGPIGWWGEFAHVFGSIPVMALLTVFLVSMWRGWRWVLAPVSFAAMALAVLLYIGSGAETRAQAVAEGCVGNVYPAAAALALVSVLAFVRFWQKLG